MIRKIVLLLVCLMVSLSLIEVSCTPETTSSPTPGAQTATPASTASVASNWWDDMGEPEYGGQLTLHLAGWEVSNDPAKPIGSGSAIWLESLFAPDWTVSPDDWYWPCKFFPEQYIQGLLADSWEWKDLQTVTVKLKEGIHWQDKAPVNGREFTAEDVVYSYDRLLGTGNGFTEPNPFWASQLPGIEKVVAVDDYTVEFKLKKPGATILYQILEGEVMIVTPIVAREWVEQGDTDNWQNAVGTGPWMLTELVQNTSLTYSPNPDYWGYDERHPENQLPYLDTLKYTVISDLSTAVAALRSGQIDMMTENRAGVLTLTLAEGLTRTNPEILQGTYGGPGVTLEMRCDTEPFTDIRVRKALNMAIDRELIAQSYYNGTVDGKPAGPIGVYLKGYSFAYDDWPEGLQAEYSYNPGEAQALLAEAGYPDGFVTNCLAASNDSGVEVLEICKSMFLDIGVDMDIEVMDGATLRSYVTDGNHDAMVLSTRQSSSMDPMICLQLRLSTNPNCYLRHNDTTYASMVSEIDSATTLEEARVLINEAEKYDLEQHWSVLICPTVIPTAWQPWVKGYNGEFTASGWRGFIPARLWIDQGLK